MKKFFTVPAVIIAVTLASGCAKEMKDATNEDVKRYFDAWVELSQKNGDLAEYAPWTKTANGMYIVVDDEPSEEAREYIYDSTFVLVRYTYCDLNGNVQETTEKDIAHKVDLDYDIANYYGPKTWVNSDYALTVGIRDVLNGMCIGGHRKAVIPSWLGTSDRYASEDEFLSHVTDGPHKIYDITVVDATNDILRYQTDSLIRYWDRHLGWEYEDGAVVPGNAIDKIDTDLDKKVYADHWDTTYTGFRFRQYFKNTPEKDDFGSPLMKFDDDTTLYINYTGRLLNGQVFDTTIEDTAKFYNIYNASRTYEPVEVKWSSDTTAITLGDSEDIINGFRSMIARLRNDEPGDTDKQNDGESAVAIFYSALGYGYSGSGSVIPAYAPLRFDIKTVKQEEEE